MSRYLKNTIFESSLWGLFCLMAYAFSFDFADPFSDYRYGAAGWPRAMIIIIMICALILLVTSVVEHRRNSGAIESKPVSPDEDHSEPVYGKAAVLKLTGNFFVPLLYIFLLPRTGFYLTTPFLISGYMYLLGERSLIHLAGTTLLIFFMCILIFTVLLYVPLPVGNWSGFYEINNMFLSLIK